jgi:hypothetical protein
MMADLGKNAAAGQSASPGDDGDSDDSDAGPPLLKKLKPLSNHTCLVICLPQLDAFLPFLSVVHNTPQTCPTLIDVRKLNDYLNSSSIENPKTSQPIVISSNSELDFCEHQLIK